MSKLLIDGDGVLYRAGFSMEKTQYLVMGKGDLSIRMFDNAKDANAACAEYDKVWSRKDVKPEEDALMLASVILRDITERYSALTPLLFLSPSVGNFRDLVATRAKYKGNRDAQVRPKHYAALRAYLVERYGATVAVGQEADDDLGIYMTEYPGSVCVSFDKDLLQIPGVHYNWVTKEETTISKKQGAINFWTQVIAGDPVDNVPGIEGMGPKKAHALLSTAKTTAECSLVALQAYVDKYGIDAGTAYFNETKALVWVRRERVK